LLLQEEEMKTTEKLMWGVLFLSTCAFFVWAILDRLDVLPCKYTLADVPPGYEIVYADGIYRAKWADSSRLLTVFRDSDTSLCKAIERAVEQHDYSTGKEKERTRKWEVVK
jgi:hypothetical protein